MSSAMATTAPPNASPSSQSTPPATSTTSSAPPVTNPVVPTSTTTTTSSTSTTPTTTASTTTSSAPTTKATTDSGTPTSSTSTSRGSSSETPRTDTTTGTLVTTTLSVTSTSVGESTSLATSNGQVYTTTISFTTIIAPGGSVVTAAPHKTSSGTNTGAIVGGAVGGATALIILIGLIIFCLRKRRKDEFDGNFDPAHVNSVKGGGGGGTLPNIDLGEGGIMGSGGRVREEMDEDDGMGGRLASGVNGGGIIMPYAFKPATPIGGVGGQQYQNQEHPQMQQMANVGASGYGNEKRAMRQYSATSNPNNPGYPQQIYATPLPHSDTQHQSASLSISSGSYFPATLASSANPNPNYLLNAHQNSHLNPNGVTPEPYTPGAFSTTSDGSSSIGGSGAGGVYYHPQSMGRGPSPGPSVFGSSNSGNGGRNAKETEAMGRVVVNPDDRIGGGQQGQYGPQQGQFPAVQAYLRNGPGPHQQQYHPPSSSSQPYQNPQNQFGQGQTSARPGTAVVVHEDGGRVVLRKGGEGEGEGEVLSPEIPPTYDSLPVDVRRDG